MVGLGQFGLEIERADERVRATMLHIDRSPFFKKIVTEQMPYRGPFEKDEVTEQVAELLGGEWPKEVAIFPVIAEGRVVAFLFCDNFTTGESFGETEGLEIFINHAGLALEKSLLQRRIQEMELKRDAG
jgi:GAF domain-containing protein